MIVLYLLYYIAWQSIYWALSWQHLPIPKAYISPIKSPPPSSSIPRKVPIVSIQDDPIMDDTLLFPLPHPFQSIGNTTNRECYLCWSGIYMSIRCSYKTSVHGRTEGDLLISLTYLSSNNHQIWNFTHFTKWWKQFSLV